MPIYLTFFRNDGLQEIELYDATRPLENLEHELWMSKELPKIMERLK